MLAHPNSPISDQAVKDLIDHRARASHTRYPSVSFSQHSDSPSIYSRADFSPNIPLNEWSYRSPHPAAMTDKDRLGFDDSNVGNGVVISPFQDPSDHDDSSLHEDSDYASFTSAPSTPRPPLHSRPFPAILVQDRETLYESSSVEDIEEDSRMSMLGPKMRFVSPAPWELGTDVLVEGNEEVSGATDTLRIFSGRMGGRKNKDLDKSSKSHPVSTLRTRSPAASSKRHDGGPHRYLTRESPREASHGHNSSSVLQRHVGTPRTSLASSSQSSHSVSDPFLPNNNVIHDVHISPGAASSVSPSDSLHSIPFPTHPFRPRTTATSRDSSAVRLGPVSPRSSRYIHPYANPDIIPTPGPPPSVPPPSVPLPQTPRAVQGRHHEEREKEGLPASSPPRLTTPYKASAGDSSLSSTSARIAPDENGKKDDEAAHLPRPKPSTSSRAVPAGSGQPIVLFGDSSESPMHNLITLEQARARVQITSSSGQNTQNGTTPNSKSTPSSTLVAGLGLPPGVVVDTVVMRGQVQRSNPSISSSSDSGSGSTVQEQKSSQRQRSLIAGKNMGTISSSLENETATELPGKILKHKRSAFLKLFQGSKDKERDKEQFEDSFPSTPYPVRAMSTPPQLPASEPPVPVPPLPSMHNVKRVPPPPLSVVITSPSFPPATSPARSIRENSTGRPQSPPRLRQASSPLPSSSSTQQLDHGHGSGLGAAQGSQASLSDRPRANTLIHHTQGTFETLTLRPISTLFSAQFPDLLITASPPANLPGDANLSNGQVTPSPTTPDLIDSRANSISTASDYPFTPTSGMIPTPQSLESIPSDGQPGLIEALQQQIINSRKLWQRQIWELEGQVRDLKAEIEDLRITGECETCGRAKRERRIRTAPQYTSVVDRPRPRLGSGTTRNMFGGSDA